MSNRKTFVFSAEALTRLDALRQACRMSSLSAVIRLALMVLEDLIRALGEGKSIRIVGPDGTQTIYHPLLAPDDQVIRRAGPAAA